jgi:hypothetical protein
LGQSAGFRQPGTRPHGPVIAHAGGIDEMLFVLVPLLVFLTLQWLNRRKGAATPAPDEELGERLERRRRLAGGLIPNPEADRPKADELPDEP